MFWSAAKLPLSEEQQQWIEASLQWLIKQFGVEYFLNRRLILPQPAFFPDKFNGTEECVLKLVERICSYMDVDSGVIVVEMFSDRDDTALKHRLGGDSQHSGAGGTFSKAKGEKMKVAINISQLKNPTG